MHPQLRLMAAYNSRSNGIIGNAIQRNNISARVFPCLFFETPQATINHIAGVTDLWLARLHGDHAAAQKFHFLYNNGNSDLDQTTTMQKKSDGQRWLELCPEFDKSLEWLAKSSTAAEDAITMRKNENSNDNEDFFASQQFSYFTTDGKEVKANRAACFMHLMNHGTHHRGQLHAALVESGDRDVVLDITALMDVR